MCGGTWGNMAPYAVEALPAVSRIATPTAVVVPNKGNFPIAQIYVSCTAAAGASESVVFNFDVLNKKTGTYAEVLDSDAVIAVSENLYQIGGVGSDSSDLFTSFHPGAGIRVRPVHANTDAITYQVTVQWLRN